MTELSNMNQPTTLEPYNLFSTDPVLADAVAREGASDLAGLADFGERMGTEAMFGLGRDANAFSPTLRTHDRFGDRVDEVDYHPAYHSLMEFSIREGIHASHYDGRPGDGRYIERNARMFMGAQVEVGHHCPTSMTGAVLHALNHQPDVAEVWAPRIKTRSYDPRLIEASKKSGVLMGMGMTERQGGSDVRANTSTAAPIDGGGPGGLYALTGHKWFTSAPMCDAFLVLAYAPNGLSCFLLPRILPDESRNSIHLMRLKDKLGNRSNASSEIEYTDATAWLIGEEGRGVNTIIEMVSGTRVDCTNWSAAMMRQAVSQAAWHVSGREAFGARLIDKPLMQNVVADLEIETEAATLMVMRLSGAFERSTVDEDEKAFFRLGSAVAKYWVTKRSTPIIREALECVGGNGFVEESILPRLYREAPLNAIWEGAGNVIALDVVRALQRAPEAGVAFVAELERASGVDPTLDGAIDQVKAALKEPSLNEADARRFIEQLAIAWSSALLIQHAPDAVSDAYVDSRLAGDHGFELGTLSSNVDVAAISRRAVPLPA